MKTIQNIFFSMATIVVAGQRYQEIVIDRIKIPLDVGVYYPPTSQQHFVDCADCLRRTAPRSKPVRLGLGSSLRRLARLLSDTPAGRSGLALSGQSARTAHDPSEPLGWAEIRHPFHPLRGQSFPVLILKTRRVAGIDTLILRGLEHGTFGVAREWTDWGEPSPSLGLPPRRWDADLLLDLVNLLEQLSSQSSRELPKGD